MSAGRDPFAHYRDRLAAMGFRPSSARGQNFLLDASLHRWIAAQAEIGAGDLALEIGVGLGFLTRELAATGAAVLGVEIDERLFAVARDELAALANVALLCTDALGGDGGELAPQLHTELAARLPAAAAFAVVANLPYAVAGPLLAHLFLLPRLPDRIVVLVQRELGERLAAGPGGRDYGGLSAQLQSAYRVEVLRKVGAEVFRPRPKVGSVVVRLCLQPAAARWPAADRRGFQAFVRQLFAQRRKTLRTTLALAAAGRPLPELSAADWGRRAETLGPGEVLALWRRVGEAEVPGRPA